MERRGGATTSGSKAAGRGNANGKMPLNDTAATTAAATEEEGLASEVLGTKRPLERSDEPMAGGRRAKRAAATASNANAPASVVAKEEPILEPLTAAAAEEAPEDEAGQAGQAGQAEEDRYPAIDPSIRKESQPGRPAGSEDTDAGGAKKRKGRDDGYEAIDKDLINQIVPGTRDPQSYLPHYNAQGQASASGPGSGSVYDGFARDVEYGNRRTSLPGVYPSQQADPSSGAGGPGTNAAPRHPFSHDLTTPTYPSSSAAIAGVLSATGAPADHGFPIDHSLEHLKETPYSRSPELRVSHKIAERKRRKEMKDLFDELRDALPVDRALKTSKWEILTKACEYIHQIKENQDLMGRELDQLRRERAGIM